MAGKLPQARSRHEAGHAVIARKLGCHVTCVDARTKNPNVTQASLGHAAEAEGLDVTARVAAHEKDAIVALAGLEVNRRDFPHLSVRDIITDTDDDIVNARSAIYRIVCLMIGQPVPRNNIEVEITQAMAGKMTDVYVRLLKVTATLIERHWAAIVRVGKHLERHGRVDNQAELDDLIARAERLASG
jgi:hypothetical protein